MRRQAPEILNPWVFSAILAGHTLNGGVQLLNAWRPEPETASGIYVSGLLWFLVHAAVQFSRMLFVQPVDG